MSLIHKHSNDETILAQTRKKIVKFVWESNVSLWTDHSPICHLRRIEPFPLWLDWKYFEFINLNYRIGLVQPPTYLPFASSFFSLIYLTASLFTHVLFVGFFVDPTWFNLTWCRTRINWGQSSSLISLTCICYAWLDKYFLSSPGTCINHANDIYCFCWSINSSQCE